jgi:sRNA-binding carbon storage regulator CsrA
MALELTRKTGTSVEIGGPPTILTLTVKAVAENYIRLNLKTNDDDRLYTVRLGEVYTIHISAGPINIKLLAIDRGDARLSFDCARHIRIERPERGA